MLNTNDAIATIAVKDLDEARKFYEQKLGFTLQETDQHHYVNYTSGCSKVMVYKSQFAGGYKATVATWDVGPGIGKLVQELKSKGVTFEHYDMPGAKLDGDIHEFGETKNAWCKDPDGNILSFFSNSK